MAMAADGISVSFLKYELASTIEQAVRGAVEAVLKETARVVGAKLAAARDAAAESHRENRSLRERLEVSESELKAVRYYMTAAEKNIKQCLLLNQSRPSPARARPGSDEHAAPFPTFHKDAAEPAPRRSFRSATGRLHYNSKTPPSVGLCLPTVQSEWTRNVINRRKVRTGSPVVHHEASASHVQLETESMLAREEGEDTFYISDEGMTGKGYKTSASALQDLTREEQEEEESSVLSMKPPNDSSDLSKFEFELGGAAGNVNELGLIQVMDGNEELKRSVVKIEDEHEVQCMEPPKMDSLVAPSSSSHSQPQILTAPVPSGEAQAQAQALLGLLAPVEGDLGPVDGRRDSSEKVHRCNVCGRGFRRFYCLKTHQRIHTGERPYPCRFCEKRFRHLDSLHKHQRIHTGERPYRCALCGCCFRELGQLKKHRLKHSPQTLAIGTAAAPPNHPALSLLSTATASSTSSSSSYIWPQLNSQSLDPI